eukprot:6184832-Pleurochrysis_carterae.AAC.1
MPLKRGRHLEVRAQNTPATKRSHQLPHGANQSAHHGPEYGAHAFHTQVSTQAIVSSTRNGPRSKVDAASGLRTRHGGRG